MTSGSVAVDIGASSGRVILGHLVDGRLALTETHRFETPLVRDPATGLQSWDLVRIEAEIRAGISAAERLGPVESVGIDTWGVDYVLLDAAENPVGPAVSYRDHRTDGVMERMVERLSAGDIYRRTGIQFMPFNTIYQLAATAETHPEWLARAHRFAMIPDYLHFRLCGVLANEYTNATTTQIFNVSTDNWDSELLAAAGVRRPLMSRPVEAGTTLGEFVSAASGRAIKVIAPATHDTGSAVAATPLMSADEAFISSGTWSLMGFESRVPFLDEQARALNFSNEGGAERRFRVLKNIMGLWLIQRVRAELGSPSHADLVASAASSRPFAAIIDPADQRFLNPDSMIEAIRAACIETEQEPPADAATLARCVFDSLALSYRRVKEEIEALRGQSLRRVRIVGGGCHNELLDQLCADACGVPVTAGPVETTALGNLAVQLMALGRIASLDEARAIVLESFPPRQFLPREAVPDEIWHRFCSLAKK
ncbi:rhamnulokinase [Consotaella salsifontis]|uniref:Rhamnulokinase n=1 Tax=Consotaella salsifontis TaxID=1365950 RepID=A0A1T4P0P3_9HYPH|nr:rhamnulokinase [Consotaella salsifontis]SJZ85009.1 L-rhamnulokinase [Consotaella salsifontis]